MQRLERLEADAGEPLRQHVRAQRDQRAHDRHRQRFADARGVAADEIELERGEIAGGNRDVRQRAESGVDAVDRRARRRVPIDDGARRAHARDRVGRERDTFVAVGDAASASSVSDVPSSRITRGVSF